MQFDLKWRKIDPQIALKTNSASFLTLHMVVAFELYVIPALVRPKN